MVSRDGENAKLISKSNFEEEKDLQKYLEDNPDIIPIYEIDENGQLLVLAREFSTESGPMDALGTDKKGEIYVIETKLYKNPDKRKVVAQVLDYGAALNNVDSNEFLSHIENETHNKYQKSLKDRLQSTFDKLGEEEILQLIENIKKNLSNGEFRFVVLLDKVEMRLKDLVYFINQNSKFTIYPVEIEFYKFENYQIVIPKLYGAEIKKSIGVRSSSSWDEKRFLESAKINLNEIQFQSLNKLYDFLKVFSDEWNFGEGSFKPIFVKIHPTVSFLRLKSDGSIEVAFHHLKGNAEMEKYRDDLKHKLLKFVTISDDYKSRAITVEIDHWSPVVEEFIQAVKDLIQK